MRAVCQKCRCAFEREPGEPWKKLCIDCWKSVKAKEASNESLLRAQVFALQERLWRAETRAKQLEARQATAGRQFDVEELKTLRRLCHPDRHGGSDASTRMSQRINQLLDGGR
jgi:hypothetical protein